METTFEAVNNTIIVALIANISGVIPKSVSMVEIKTFEDEIRALLQEARGN